MHHKRKRPKSARAGCLMCKPHKVSGSKLSDQLTPGERRQAQPDEGRPHPKGKPSRRRWCRGKLNVAHQPVCMTYEQAKGKVSNPEQYKPQGLARKLAERFLVCQSCGKELARWCGLGEPPAWVGSPPGAPDQNAG